jgi:hypothetical protein
LRHTAVLRGHDSIAIAMGQRGHGLRLRLGEDLLGLGQGRGDPRDPRETGLGQLVQILGVREGAVGDKIGGAGGGVELRNVVADDLAECFAIVTITTEGLHQHRDPGLVLHDQCQHHVVEVGTMVPTLPLGDVHDVVVRGRSAVLPAIDMETWALITAPATSH